MRLATAKGITSGLALRLAAMIMLALLPLGFLALAQTHKTVAQAEETRLAASVGHTLQEALREIRLLRASQVTAQLLAASLRNAPADCGPVVSAYVTADRLIARAAQISPNGQIICSSDGSRQDFGQSSRFAGVLAAPGSRIFYDPAWARPGETDISLTWPVTDARGQTTGLVLLSLPEAVILRMADDPAARAPGPAQHPDAMIAVNGAGEVIFSSTGIADAAAFLPQGTPLSDLAGTEARSFFDDAKNGHRQMFSWAPVNSDLALLAAWPVPAADGFLNHYILPYLFPALMWLVGVGVTILGVERLVTRHIRRLSRAMRDFTAENRLAQGVSLDHPPAEIASLAEAYQVMTRTILRDEAELENLVRQKDELLREVHHRTGNSLQLIASFLRMHRRETEDEDIRLVLDDLHNRVMSLSSVHLGLYRMAGGSEVAVDLLMAEVITKVDLIHGRTGKTGSVRADLMPLLLPSQQAVPLALLLAEILSCFPPAEAGAQPIRIRLRHETNSATQSLVRLEVSGAATAHGRLIGAHSGAPSVIGARLIRGFVTQLAGQLEIVEEGPRVSAVVSFAFQPDESQATDGIPASIKSAEASNPGTPSAAANQVLH
ncbi:hypothetical protein HOY34_01795 [Xinfangfangia sp. D13-10-4-6]|uniref:sensor histidine kinase n=1 Tax=Pseudogemmobacter hezensis TaxID=2737662 RepID=UPI0015565237|nr:sensor histidine kinase [Pseudogemmobacter hezensis]NPD13931.1 hypothetical protein [Pseudogemmobacter hezensis]